MNDDKDPMLAKWRELIADVRELPFTTFSMLLVDFVWDTRVPSADLAGIIQTCVLTPVAVSIGIVDKDVTELGIQAENLIVRLGEFRDESIAPAAYPTMPRFLLRGQAEPLDECDRWFRDNYNLHALGVMSRDWRAAVRDALPRFVAARVLSLDWLRTVHLD
jgi:hypothetical protein